MQVKIHNGLPAGAIPVRVESVTLLSPLDADGASCGGSERISLSGIGYLLLSEGKKSIVYEGREGDGMTKTVLTLENGAVRISRSGAAVSELLLDPSTATESSYRVPPFSFPLSVTLHRMTDEIKAGGGRLRLSYRMKLGGESSDVSFLLRLERMTKE